MTWTKWTLSCGIDILFKDEVSNRTWSRRSQRRSNPIMTLLYHYFTRGKAAQPYPVDRHDVHHDLTEEQREPIDNLILVFLKDGMRTTQFRLAPIWRRIRGSLSLFYGEMLKSLLGFS